MNQPVPPRDQDQGVDLPTLERMLALGGAGLRPALIAQLLQDFTRLAQALEGSEPAALERAAHELKGLAATVGAQALADHAARFDSLAAHAAPAVRDALALGLRRQIEGLCAVLRAQRQAPSAA